MTRLLIAIVAGLGLFATAFTSASDQEAATVPNMPATTVGEDPIGDWGGGDPDLAQVGHVLGQDLVGAHIDVGPDTTNFIIEVTYLPATTNGVPEVTRYSWYFLVDGQEFQLDGKFTNYSRGACDPTSGQCDPAAGKLPRDPGVAPFLLRGNCTTNEQNITLCEELAHLQADFNARTRTVRIPVPNELLALAPCSTIDGGANIFGGSISAAPSAFFTISTAPMDTLAIWDSLTIPSGDPDNPCPEA